MSLIWKIPSDLAGLAGVCGPRVALRWLWCILKTAPRVLRSRNLQPADVAMGEGPFRVRHGKATALLEGHRVLSSIREIWVRDAYLRDDFLTIDPNALVVDLGANNGRFTCLALAHGPKVRVVAVEPGEDFVRTLLETVRHNGWEDRVQVVRALVGGKKTKQEAMLHQERYAGAEFIDEEELIQRGGIDRIDFLKCDIEGSEFDLLTPDSALLAMARQLAIEIHAEAGDPRAFLSMLRNQGFEVGPVEWAGGSCVALAKRRADA